jgi:lipoic acid synthetase
MRVARMCDGASRSGKQPLATVSSIPRHLQDPFSQEPYLQPHAPNAARMPVWIRQNLGRERHYPGTAAAVHGHGLHTVCEEARCPNRGECWSRGTATFMLLGDTCTRACAFCSVKTGRPTWSDADEPRRVAQACLDLGLNFVVLTSVNRDDLDDGGAGCFAETLRELRLGKPDMGVEFLTPDFRDVQDQAAGLFNATLARLPDACRRDLIWGHNMETVPRLYKEARKGAKYERSLDLLALAARQPNMEAKSALMLGLGETRDEVLAVLPTCAPPASGACPWASTCAPPWTSCRWPATCRRRNSPTTRPPRGPWALPGSRPGPWCAVRILLRKFSRQLAVGSWQPPPCPRRLTTAN